MLTIIYHPDDRATAQRLITDLQAAGTSPIDLTADSSSPKGDVLIAVISPASNADSAAQVENAIIQVLDDGGHIVPVIVKGGHMPRLIDHLEYANLSDRYDVTVIQRLIASVTAPNANAPIRVRTPKVRQSNNLAGWVIGVAAIIMFSLGLYAVGVLGIQRPNEEFDAVDATIQAMVEQELAPQLATAEGFLPVDADQGYLYPATALAFPTRLRPFVVATATGYAEQSGIYAATPTPAS